MSQHATKNIIYSGEMILGNYLAEKCIKYYNINCMDCIRFFRTTYFIFKFGIVQNLAPLPPQR